ncbi:hypothetical protein BDY19DRAFT_908338 [Irpex rosettiformis]|uniref:Uncharacterized protein n=1 Tax=Irpex rosettiformis TaxID=378272 RepID=A0ACB8TWF8_9APHY|nr:hypothetical protein BDY19DRAFT_908338 [Irpex rosettiformis]
MEFQGDWFPQISGYATADDLNDNTTSMVSENEEDNVEDMLDAFTDSDNMDTAATIGTELFDSDSDMSEVEEIVDAFTDDDTRMATDSDEADDEADSDSDADSISVISSVTPRHHYDFSQPHEDQVMVCYEVSEIGAPTPEAVSDDETDHYTAGAPDHDDTDCSWGGGVEFADGETAPTPRAVSPASDDPQSYTPTPGMDQDVSDEEGLTSHSSSPDPVLGSTVAQLEGLDEYSTTTDFVDSGEETGHGRYSTPPTTPEGSIDDDTEIEVMDEYEVEAEDNGEGEDEYSRDRDEAEDNLEGEGEDTEGGDTGAEDTEVEDTEVEDTEVEDTEVEDTEVEDTEVEDTEVEDTEVEDESKTETTGSFTSEPSTVSRFLGRMQDRSHDLLAGPVMGDATYADLDANSLMISHFGTTDPDFVLSDSEKEDDGRSRAPALRSPSPEPSRFRPAAGSYEPFFDEVITSTGTDSHSNYDVESSLAGMPRNRGSTSAPVQKTVSYWLRTME